uniref:Putative secreted protein n=1 Tax=Anopheles darlingi TaxID=43151 RepID=A0A2M4DBT1_ANODA
MLAAPPAAPLLPFFVVAGRCVPGAEGDALHTDAFIFISLSFQLVAQPPKRTTVYGVDVHASSERAARRIIRRFPRSSRTAVVTEDPSFFLFLAPFLVYLCNTHTHTFWGGEPERPERRNVIASGVLIGISSGRQKGHGSSS